MLQFLVKSINYKIVQMRNSQPNRRMQELEMQPNIPAEQSQQLLEVGQNVFQSLYNSQKKLNTLKSKATVLYGATKSNLTTLLCLIAGQTIIAQRINARTLYKVQGDTDYIIGNAIQIQTIQPNIYNGQDQSFIEFGAQAEYTKNSKKKAKDQLITSTSFLKAIKTIKQIRFAIVIQQNDLLDSTFFKDLLQQFIEKFAYDTLRSEQKGIFLKSVLLIITRAQQGATQEEYKNSIKNFRDSPELNFSNDQIDFLNYFGQQKSSCVHIFQRAKIGSRKNENFFQLFNISYYDYQGQNINKILQERINSLQKNPKLQQLNDLIKQRLGVLSGLLKQLIPFINKQKLNFLKNASDYNKQWVSLAQFVKKNQVYSDATFQENINYIQNNVYTNSISQRSTHFIHLLQSLQKIYKESHKDVIFGAKLQQQLQWMLKYFSLTFSSKVQHQNLIFKIMFLIKRMFQETFQINELNKELIRKKFNQELQKFKQYIKEFKPQSLKLAYLLFLKKINQKIQLQYTEQKIKEKKRIRDQKKLFDDQLLFFCCSFYSFIKLFLKQNNKLKIQKQQFDYYFSIAKLLRKCILFMYDDKSSIEKKILLQSKTKSTLCLYLNISLLQVYQKIYQIDQKKQESLRSKQLSNQIRKYLLSLGECLTNLKQYYSASRLFYFINACSRYDSVIEALIQTLESSNQKIKYLLEWGKFKQDRSQVQDAIKIYQMAKDLETEDHNVLQEINQKILKAQKKKYKIVSQEKWYKRIFIFFFENNEEVNLNQTSRLSNSFIKSQNITESQVYMYAFVHIALQQRKPISYRQFVEKTGELKKIQEIQNFHIQNQIQMNNNA